MSGPGYTQCQACGAGYLAETQHECVPKDFGLVCEHGGLKRKCDICDLRAQLAQAQEESAAKDALLVELREWIASHSDDDAGTPQAHDYPTCGVFGPYPEGYSHRGHHPDFIEACNCTRARLLADDDLNAATQRVEARIREEAALVVERIEMDSGHKTVRLLDVAARIRTGKT